MRPAETVRYCLSMVGMAYTPRDGTPLPGGIYAAPTNTRYRVYDTGDGG